MRARSRYYGVSVERNLFLSGNEAIARGAVRAGVTFACGCPGTPSAEILAAMVADPTDAAGIFRAQWCVNEKVALENAIGASLAGVRTLVTMKNVGLNVAADPFMALSLAGVNAGLVIVSVDDPGMLSSQSEQDSRRFAAFAKIPMLEPSDSQESYDFLAEAFALSEEFDTPVMLRTTMRLAHSRSRAIPRAPVVVVPRPYEQVLDKYVVVPQYARARNRRVLERLQLLRARAEQTPLNVLEAGTADFGIIASGAAYNYARAAFPRAWFLKLGLSHPLPYQKVIRLYRSVSRVAVVEELEPYIEEQVRMLGLAVIGKEAIPVDGELNREVVFAALEPYIQHLSAPRRRAIVPPPPRISSSVETESEPPAGGELEPPGRASALCAGCGQRSVLTSLRKLKVAPLGGIGCHTLGVSPSPLALESCLCMGAGIGMMAGMNKVLGRKAAAAVLDDSAFLHSGITALVDACHSEGEGLVIVFDCSRGSLSDIERLCVGIGVRCHTLGARGAKAVQAELATELDTPGLGVVIACAPSAG